MCHIRIFTFSKLHGTEKEKKSKSYFLILKFKMAILKNSNQIPASIFVRSPNKAKTRTKYVLYAPQICILQTENST